jgi:hypothetical protein
MFSRHITIHSLPRYSRLFVEVVVLSLEAFLPVDSCNQIDALRKVRFLDIKSTRERFLGAFHNGLCVLIIQPLGSKIKRTRTVSSAA